MNNLSDYYRITSSAKALEEQEHKTLASYALKAEERRKKLKEKFREDRPNSPLEHRTAYHRDRDRILWSKAFKRMQHKTQVFPHYVEDHYKRRLTHSLEVAQIATTVARALKLNEAATEAIALGHDLGHTPFGHAGEEALNEILTVKSEAIDPKIRRYLKKLRKREANTIIPIFGFDHCVHAIEVISRSEKEYDPETSHGGFNLTFDIRDGILKHMYERKHDEDRPFSNIQAVVKLDKYKNFKNNKGSLEAQCVYFADKVTYLLGDIEDGIRSDIFQFRQDRRFKEPFSKHHFFDKLQQKHYKYRPENELKLQNKDDFISFRSQALTTLILDCIDNANQNLKSNKLEDGDICKVLNCENRIISVSDELQDSWKVFYKQWMENFLFKHERVKACSFKAKMIVTGLFEAYWRDENLIQESYRMHSTKAYKKIGIQDNELIKLITVLNYIAGMTDAFATEQHTRLYMSSERIRF